MATAQSDVPRSGTVASLINRMSMSQVDTPPTTNAPKLPVESSRMARELHKVLYEYASQQTDEISLHVGEIIEVIAKVEEGWNKGKSQKSGQIGMYPTNYCEVYSVSRPVSSLKSAGVVKPAPVGGSVPSNTMNNDEQPTTLKRLSTVESSSKPKEDLKEYARITFVYEPQHPDELPLLEVGKLVLVTNKETGDPGWFEGELDGKKGVFPDNFVELIPRVSSSPSSHGVNGTSITKASEKPPAALPGAVSVFPPQVPLKPPKAVLPSVSTSSSASVTVGSGAASASTDSTNANSSTPSGRPFSSLQTPGTPPQAEKVTNNNNEEQKSPEKKAQTFSEKRNAILANLKVNNIIRPPGQKTPEAGEVSRSPSNEEGSLASSPTPLNHITKNRPKPPGSRRPISMYPPTATDPFENLAGGMSNAMTRSEANILEETSVTVEKTSFSSPKVAESSSPRPSSSGDTPSVSAAGATVTTFSAMTPPPAMKDESEWVSRAEHNSVLARLSHLEERLAALERK